MKTSTKVLLLVVVVVAAGTVYHLVAALVPSPSAPAAAFCPPAIDQTAAPDTSPLHGRAAVFTGPGPHPMVFADVSPTMPFDDHNPLPPSWQATGANADRVQLVVCQYRFEPGGNSSDTSLTCGRYTETVGVPDFELVPSRITYTYRVYEASTGKLVGQVAIKGTSFTCPDSYTAPPHVVATATDAEVAAALAHYAEPPG